MLNSRYWKGYNRLIDNALSKKRVKLPKTHSNYEYYEKHHIVPKCFGGSDNNSNLVLLTAKEHFIAHYLLTKVTNGSQKRSMIHAFNSFCMDKDGNRTITTPRLFEKARKMKSEAMLGEKNPNYGGVTQTEESKKKISENRIGKCTGSDNGWHKSNRTAEELKERSSKSNKARKEKFETLSPEEQEKVKKRHSDSVKEAWLKASEESKNKRLSALRYWEYKSVEELEKIDKRKSNPGTSNGRANVFILTSPEGIEHKVEMIPGLRRFCEQNNLVYNIVYKYSKTGAIIPPVSKMDTKYSKDDKYKITRDNTTGWIITKQRINQ